MDEFKWSICSNRSDRKLIFFNRRGDYFNVRLEGCSATAEIRVWGYTDCELLLDMFDAMEAAPQGWESPFEWSSIEGELTLKATSDKLGHVLINVKLYDRQNGGGEAWSLSAGIETALGELPGLAAEAKKFFG
jgi:hypothetical protein